MTLFANRRRVSWLAACAAAGLILGQLATYPGEFWRGIFLLGIVPGILQGFVLWRATSRFVLWLALTQIGVVTTYVFTVTAVLLIAYLVASVAPGDVPMDRPDLLRGWVVVLSGYFIGAVGLGGLQVAGFPRHERRVSWILATMLGGVAVAPITPALTGLGQWVWPISLPIQLVGLIGGSLYGVVTAVALPRSEP